MSEKNISDIDYKPKTTGYSSPVDNNSTMLFENLKWVDTKEAAQFLRVSVGSLRNMVYRRQVRARKFRRKLYFKVSELNRLIENSNI